MLISLSFRLYGVGGEIFLQDLSTPSPSLEMTRKKENRQALELWRSPNKFVYL